MPQGDGTAQGGRPEPAGDPVVQTTEALDGAEAAEEVDRLEVLEAALARLEAELDGDEASPAGR